MKKRRGIAKGRSVRCDGGSEFCLFLLDFFLYEAEGGAWREEIRDPQACSAGTDALMY